MLEPSIKPDELRKLLTEYRVSQNLTLRALAAQIGGVTHATLSNFELGKTWPTRKTLLRIERFLRQKKAA